MPELTFRRWILEKEKEKRYSYIRKKLARGTVGACILSGLALLLFLFCIAYSFYRRGEAGLTIAAIALLSVHFSAFSLRFAIPFERGKFLEKRPIYIAVAIDIFLLFSWLFFLFLVIRG